MQTQPIFLSRLSRLVLAVVVALPLLAVCAGPSKAEDPFEVTEAKWRVERKELRVEGHAATPDAAVLVRDAETDTLVGCAMVRADGKWMLKLRNPKRIPAKMEVECEGVVKECVVAYASN